MKRKTYAPDELAAIGEKIQAAIPKGLNMRGYFLFRRQIRERAGISQQDWDAYTFSRVQALADAERERRSFRGRLRRLRNWLRSRFGSAQVA